MNLEPMWEALEKYQKYAEKRGFGEQWLRMTTDRTAQTACDAAFDAAVNEAPYAVWLANMVVLTLTGKEEYALDVIRAIEQENKE